MEVKINKNDNIVTAEFNGRLDTPASLEIAQDIESIKKEASGTIVLDCSQLSYISSSGLRLFLSIRKAAAEKAAR